jgi:hypothetical protein
MKFYTRNFKIWKSLTRKPKIFCSFRHIFFQNAINRRSKNRWIDGILKDMEVLKVKNWKDSTRNRKEWNKLVEKAKAHPGL